MRPVTKHGHGTTARLARNTILLSLGLLVKMLPHGRILVPLELIVHQIAGAVKPFIGMFEHVSVKTIVDLGQRHIVSGSEITKSEL